MDARADAEEGVPRRAVTALDHQALLLFVGRAAREEDLGLVALHSGHRVAVFGLVLEKGGGQVLLLDSGYRDPGIHARSQRRLAAYHAGGDQARVAVLARIREALAAIAR